MTLRLFEDWNGPFQEKEACALGEGRDPGERPSVLASPTSLMEVPLVSYLLSFLLLGFHSDVWKGTSSESVPGTDTHVHLWEPQVLHL